VKSHPHRIERDENARNDRFIVHERDPILEVGFEPDTPDEAYLPVANTWSLAMLTAMWI
jgi:hypothetical protein